MAGKTDQRPASPDNPRTLKRVSDGAVARCTDPAEYLTMTAAQGYRDITDEGGSGKGKGGGSSNAGSGGSGGGSGSGSNAQAGSGGTA